MKVEPSIKYVIYEVMFAYIACILSYQLIFLYFLLSWVLGLGVNTFLHNQRGSIILSQEPNHPLMINVGTKKGDIWWNGWIRSWGGDFWVKNKIIHEWWCIWALGGASYVLHLWGNDGEARDLIFHEFVVTERGKLLKHGVAWPINSIKTIEQQ